MKTIIFVTSLFLSTTFAPLAMADDVQVPYPEGYRTWTHVKSMLIEPGHALASPFQGIHHIYGNAKAMQGQSSGDYPDGSVFVFDLLDYNAADQTIQEADRKLIGVMYKDARRYSSTGGWGFEGFAADSRTERLTRDGGQGCYACHESQGGNGYVYSRFRK